MLMQSPGRLGLAQAVIVRLFDVPVAVGVSDPRVEQPEPMGDEAAHLTRAVPARKREFAAGRTAARAAMVELNLHPQPIPASDDRAPIWPQGIHGSISHSPTLCAAVIGTGPHTIGLDIEENTDLVAGLQSTICSDAELARIAGPNQARLAKLIFSAKEATYKAQYPLTGLLFGFDHIDIQLDLPRQRFTATFLKPAGIFNIGDTLPGRFDVVVDHLVTAVHTGQGAPEGA